MDQSPSSSFKFLGRLKSAHALLGVLAIVLLGGFGLSLEFHFDLGIYVFCIALVAVVAVVLMRYSIKGPESERLQTSLSFTHQANEIHTHIHNVDDPRLILEALINRRLLPPPAGIIQGSASDPSAIRLIDETTASALQAEDSKLSLPVKTTSEPNSTAVQG